MTVVEWAPTVAALTVTATFIGGLAAWAIKRYADQIVNSVIKEYLSELKTNGGSSLRDEVKEIRRDLISIKTDMARLEGRFAQHLASADSDVW